MPTGPKVLFHHQLQKRRQPRKRTLVGSKPELTLKLILSWADAFHKRTGRWPGEDSGQIPESLDDNWNIVTDALRQGKRGLERGSTLARLLETHRGVRNIANLPKLCVQQILAWADAHKKRTGRWPKITDGPIRDAPGETWSGVQSALCAGVRGLRGSDTLPRLLAKHRGVRNTMALPRLTPTLILQWADAHERRTATWPTQYSGRISDAPGETWAAVQSALQTGRRGLPGGSSIAQLLDQHRGVPHPKNLSRLTIPQILRWADAHSKRTGQWPNRTSGAVVDAPDETWAAVHNALRCGCRGLPGGSSLPRVLAEHRGKRNPSDRPRLTPEIILGWADLHHGRTGSWPQVRSGPIADAPGESWWSVQSALQKGGRGLVGRTTLARFLAEHRGVRNPQALSRLNPTLILKWADAHKRRTGKWPKRKDGSIPEAPGETWMNAQVALHLGTRGLPGGSSLTRLLAEHRGVRNIQALPRLNPALILRWIGAHHKRFGAWPKAHEGPILDAPGETWLAVDTALRGGGRGLPGGSSLSRLREQHGTRTANQP